eukprot:1405099-Prorocentrum_lima.AAC.1
MAEITARPEGYVAVVGYGRVGRTVCGMLGKYVGCSLGCADCMGVCGVLLRVGVVKLGEPDLART